VEALATLRKYKKCKKRSTSCTSGKYFPLILNMYRSIAANQKKKAGAGVKLNPIGGRESTSSYIL
jgi:hypothetical protein